MGRYPRASCGLFIALVVVQDRLMGLNPDTGEELWRAEGVHRYVCPSVVAHDGILYAIGGGHTSLAVRAGGRGDVTKTHALWRMKKGSNVSSPVYRDGHLYWASDNSGGVYCQEAVTGQVVYQERLAPAAGLIYPPRQRQSIGGQGECDLQLSLLAPPDKREESPYENMPFCGGWNTG